MTALSRTSANAERYLHVVLLLTDHGQRAQNNDVAERMGVSAAAATRMLKTLAKRRWIDLEPYQGALLTSEGLHRALRILRRHRLLEVFLHRILGFGIQEIHQRALVMQPSVDEVFEDRLDQILGHPKIDPHGQPIPARDVTWPKLGDARLTESPPGTMGVVSRITSDDFATHAYLREQGIRPGTGIVLDGIAPFDGPVTVCVGERTLHLGQSLAKLIFIEPPQNQGMTPSPPPRRRRRA